MSTDTIAWLSGAGVFVVSIIVENLSKSFKPWSIILRSIGKLINAETTERLDKIETRIQALENSDKKQTLENGENQAKDARRRIISFADRIRLGEIKHSYESYDSVLDDITFYKLFCKEHKDFQNEKAVHSIAIVEREYDRCLRENDFL